MTILPTTIVAAVDAFSRLPGVGPKSAQRLVFYLLRSDKKISDDLSLSIADLKENVRLCRQCYHMCDGDQELCGICRNDARDTTTICVVEEPLDIIALERPGYFKGLYHVLHGAISPVDGMGPDDLKIDALIERVKNGGVTEVILATNPTTEGEATALYIQRLIAGVTLSGVEGSDVTVTRIARGIPFGGDIEYADEMTLSRALEGRMKY